LSRNKLGAPSIYDRVTFSKSRQNPNLVQRLQYQGLLKRKMPTKQKFPKEKPQVKSTRTPEHELAIFSLLPPCNLGSAPLNIYFNFRDTANKISRPILVKKLSFLTDFYSNVSPPTRMRMNSIANVSIGRVTGRAPCSCRRRSALFACTNMLASRKPILPAQPTSSMQPHASRPQSLS